jgi:demethylmenaquinone methyltransferase/2-methoxy-6-polyprenyl-1,4-benzoquinol methylase
MNQSEDTTHFGFQTVLKHEKEDKVREVFHSVAARYDLMNDLLSLGIHRLWKRFAIELSQVKKGQQVLDLAGGSGDLAKLLYKKVGSTGKVVLADINEAMLHVGRDRLLNQGICGHIDYVQANAECLPFASNSFHCLTMGFGLRNVTNKELALQSMFRVCKPGGKLMVLEFSKPFLPGLTEIYNWYSFKVLPQLGQWAANDRASYQYLAESIRLHPGQEELKSMIEGAGFEDCRFYNLSGGIVALHIAYKY